MWQTSSNWSSRVPTVPISVSTVHHCQINLPKTQLPSVIALLRTFQWFFVCRVKSDASIYPFPVTLCAILLHFSGILITVSSHYSPEYIFVLAHILGFTWEDTNFTGLFQRVPTVIQGNESPSRGFSFHISPSELSQHGFLLYSGIYWARILSICIQYTLSLLFFYILSSMRSKPSFYSLCIT